MNNNAIQELERRYNAFLEQKELDGDANQTGAIAYFRFIEDTPVLRNIATSLFSTPSSKSVTWHEANELFQIYVLHKSISELGHPTNLVSTNSGVNRFHRYIVNGAKQFGLTDKRKVILHKESGDNRICLAGETLLCYPMKGEKPERFDIVLGLFKAEAGKSAREIAEFLWKKEKGKVVQDNIKKEIEKINTLFAKHCHASDDLILHDKLKGKNIYFLNKKQFVFEVKR